MPGFDVNGIGGNAPAPTGPSGLFATLDPRFQAEQLQNQAAALSLKRATAFQNGVPTNPDGSIDFDTIGRTQIQDGDVSGGASMLMQGLKLRMLSDPSTVANPTGAGGASGGQGGGLPSGLGSTPAAGGDNYGRAAQGQGGQGAQGAGQAGNVAPLDVYAHSIGALESNNDYQALGQKQTNGDRAYGRYQVMGSNVGPWTQEVLGQAMSPADFLAIHGGQRASATADAPPQAAPPLPPAQPGGMSYDQAATPDTPHPGGALSNSADDGYLSGALKGAATGAIKGVGDAVGAVSGLSNLTDYLIARGESAVTGKPVDQVMAEHAATRQRVQTNMAKDPLGRLAVATDPANVMPAPSDVTAPILSRTGEYVPTSGPGRIAQAAVEGAVGGVGPGMGAISPGTAGSAALGALARQAPAVAAASGVGQAATDFTGDPLVGLGAGLAGVPLAEAAGSRLLKAAAPIAGGSFLNDAPIAGPMIRRARGNDVAGMILGAADDPAAVRAAANAPAPAPAVPNSPQTFAGQIGTDQGLLEAEKALRNTKAEKADPDGPAPTYFNKVDAGQSAAQTAALQGLQPTGDVFAPGQLLGQRMDAVDAAAQDAVDRLQAAHADAVAGRAGATQAYADQANADLAARQADRTQAGLDFAGEQRADLADRTIARGQASGDDKAQADAFRQAQQDRLVGQFAEAQARQLGAAQDAASPLAGGQVPADGLGGALRSSIEAVRSGQKAIHGALYRAVDPDGTLNLVATPISDGAARIVGDVRADGSAMTAAEAPLFARAATLPDVAPYRVVHALDRDVSAAMSAEQRAAGESPAWARLSRLGCGRHLGPTRPALRTSAPS